MESSSTMFSVFKKTIDGSFLLTVTDATLAEKIVKLDAIEVSGLPRLVNDEVLKATMKEFGHMFSIQRDAMQRFPGVQNGIRTMTMTVKSPIPSFLSIGGYEAKIWYRGQEYRVCRVCGLTGHISKNCPEVRCFFMPRVRACECSNDLQCLYCFEVGHSSERCPEWLQDEETKKKDKKREEEEEMEKPQSVRN